VRYLYYPGCSLEGTALEYDTSTRAFLAALGVELREVDQWTCCGATAAQSTSSLLALVLPARNLALAEKLGDRDEILVPCSACYLNLKHVEVKAGRDGRLLGRINEVLAVEGLHWSGGTRVRHLLEVAARGVGPEAIAQGLKRPLGDLVVAPYYGCQCLRPYALFDDPEAPRSMEGLIEATGATVHPWSAGARCCGAAHMSTHRQVALELVTSILRKAKGAHVIVTVCPMCQMNLEGYQKRISKTCGEDLRVAVVYLPQFLGLALGLSPDDVRLDLNLAVTETFRRRVAGLEKAIGSPGASKR